MNNIRQPVLSVLSLNKILLETLQNSLYILYIIILYIYIYNIIIERKRERQRQRQTERKRQTDRETERQRDVSICAFDENLSNFAKRIIWVTTYCPCIKFSK